VNEAAWEIVRKAVPGRTPEAFFSTPKASKKITG